MKHAFRGFLFGFFALASATLAQGQEFIFPHPVYPFEGRKRGMQGHGIVRATFDGYFRPPIKVEMAQSTHSPLLDYVTIDWVKRYWVIANFSAEERRNPAAMHARLKQYIPTAINREATVAMFVKSKPKPVTFPLTLNEGISFVLR